MTKHILDEFEDRARAGDGQFAIAYAVLRMAESHEKLRGDLCFGRTQTSPPGVLEKIGMEMAELASAVKNLDLSS
ncbi:MAG TPA: hypothetical protein VJM81_02525 [Rhizorhapis sp.]|uniref:hypothetical protein n=1 Tax=Rhizorhapis sp. TaxID=1968842 RepID=UPI002B465D51|nr:hypothetical protein [Rhizorhapis sp.]HKR16247.1 hypothetical protein [Rhizorhapis sp.]HKX22131.1 hypothetical protein [Rhizorhapis sp.]